MLLGFSIVAKMTILKADDERLSYAAERGTFVETVQVSGTYNKTYTDAEEAQSYAAYQQAISVLTTANQNKQMADVAMWTAQKTLLDAREAKRVKDDNKDDYEDLEEQSIDASTVQSEKNFTATEQKYKEADVAIAAAQAQVAAAKVDYEDTLADEPLLSVDINEVYVPSLYVGQKVKVIFDALNNKELFGKIISIDSIGSINAGVVTFEVKISIDSLPSAIKPNMTASTQIDLIHKDNVITIPKSAVILKNNKTYVQKIADKEDELTEVQLGEEGFAKVEVLKGIGDGIVIVANANTKMKNDK